MRNVPPIAALLALPAGFQVAWLRSLGLGEPTQFVAGDLLGGDFTGTDLTGAMFVNVRLELAKFHGSCLDAADFSKADLRGAALEHAVYTAETRWPLEYDPSTSGAVLVGDQARIFQYLEPLGEVDQEGS